MTRSIWHRSAARLARVLGLEARVRIVDSDLVDTPMLVGWLQPAIVLPIAAHWD